MATITLVANTNYSALTVANNDTIDCNGFRLTINAQPSATNIDVVSPGTSGTVTISGAYDIATWSFVAGIVTMITTVPVGAKLGNIKGGSAANANAINTNQASIVGNVEGGSALNAHGIISNNGTILGAIIGGSNASANGVRDFNGNALGGFTDNTATAVGSFRGSHLFVNGPLTIITFPATIIHIYTLFGPLNPACSYSPGTEITELSEGAGNVLEALNRGMQMGRLGA